MEKEYKLLDSKLLCQGKTIKVVREELELYDSRRVVRDIVRHPGAAVFIPITADGKILMVSQYRHAVTQRLLEMPAGTINSEEAPLACAKREIMEEVGFSASEWIDLGILLPCPGFCDEIQYCYLARNLSPNKLSADDDEDIEVVELSVAEVEARIISNQIRDAKSIAIFSRAKLQGLLD